MRILRIPSTRAEPPRYFDPSSITRARLSPSKLLLPNAEDIQQVVTQTSYRKQLKVNETRISRYLDYIEKSRELSQLNRDSITVELIDILTEKVYRSVLKSAAADFSLLMEEYIDDLISTEFNP